MPLDAAGKAAHEGVLQQTYGRHKLPRALRVAITDYLVAKGWAVVDVPYDVDASDEAGWEAEWLAYLSDAGENGKAEAVMMINWLRARCAPGSGGSARGGVTQLALETLEAQGVHVSPAAASILERELASSAAGDEQAQSVNARIAFRLLTNVDPTVEQSVWWDGQYASLSSLDGSVGIDICGQEAYRKMLKPTNSRVQKPVLESALKSEEAFGQWYAAKVREFEVIGHPKASTRLVTLVTNVRGDSKGDWPHMREYLEHFFFVEYRGLGIPAVRGSASQAAATRSMVTGVVQSMIKTPAQHLALSAATGGAVSPGGSSASGSVIDLAGSLLSGSSGSRSGSSVGPSASMVGGIDVEALASVLLPQLKAQMTPELPPGGATQPPPTNRPKRCPWCRRSNCPMLEDSARMCARAVEALKLLKAAPDPDADAEGDGSKKK